MDVAVIEWMETALTAPGLTVLLVRPTLWPPKKHEDCLHRSTAAVIMKA